MADFRYRFGFKAGKITSLERVNKDGKFRYIVALIEKPNSSPHFDRTATIGDVVFLGRTGERLSTLIADQSKAVFDNNGFVIPVRSCALMTIISKL